MIDWLLGLNGVSIYVGLFAMLLGGAIGLPIPEDLPLLLAGVLLHQQKAELLPTFVTVYSGIMVGDIILYFIGRKLASSANKRGWFKDKLSPEKIEETRASIKKRGFLAILFARHLFYLRSVTFIACGAMKMDFKQFFLCDAFAALLSATLMLSLGFMFSENYQILFDYFKQFKIFLVVISIIAIGLFVLIKLRSNKRR
jgi:membrane protein DedA with SNARE-associated domain